MNPDLKQLLQDVVPEPTRTLAAGAVVSAARRQQKRRRLAAATALCAVAIGVAVPLTSIAGRGRGDSAPVAAMAASALADRAPLGEVARGALAGSGPLAHPGEGTLVGVVADEEVWLVEQASGGLCLLLVYEKYGSSGLDCQPRRDLAGKGVVFGVGGVRPDVLLLIVAVPDGYQTVRAGAGSARVQRGVAVLTFDSSRRPGGDLTVSGPGQPRLTYALGDFVPGGSAQARGTDALAGEQAQKYRLLYEFVRRADAYTQVHGSTKGFVASLSDSQRRAANDLQALSDTEGTARVGGRCLQADLRTSTVYEDVPCS